MGYFIAMTNRSALVQIDQEAQAGLRPRHAMAQLATALSAEILRPGENDGSRLDRLLARLAGTASTWALARRMRRRLRPGDVVFCADEAVGIPLAALCGGKGVKIMLLGHNLARPRAKAAFRLLSIPRKVDLFMTVSRKQAQYLHGAFGLPQDRILALSDQTDIRFFTPGAAPAKPRPIIASVGLEKRDYQTLAAATADLAVDVRISGFSADAKVIATTFPAVMPANMTRAFYSWTDLRDLYRSADVVVVSLFPNTYAAGIQGLLEAVACGTPVVVTRTEGLAEYLDRPDLITAIDMGDPIAMRSALAAKLADPAAARRQADAARAHFLPQIDSDAYVASIATAMRTLARSTR